MYDLYQCNKKDTARFILGKEGASKLFVIGLNPSTANKEKSDITVAKVEIVAANNGFEGFVMANLYPLRSTDPNNLPQNANKALVKENINNIIDCARSENAPMFWAAWGGDIVLRPYLADSFKELLMAVNAINGKWLHYGELCKNGHPRHPSRLSYSWRFKPFETKTYAEKFA